MASSTQAWTEVWIYEKSYCAFGNLDRIRQSVRGGTIMVRVERNGGKQKGFLILENGFIVDAKTLCFVESIK